MQPLWLRSHRQFRTLELLGVVLLFSAAIEDRVHAAVDHGDPSGAQLYYRQTSAKIGFSDKVKIFDTTLDDVASYLGYTGVTGKDLQDLPSAILMNLPDSLSKGTAVGSLSPTFQNATQLSALFAASPYQPGDILATRFFAPKIMNVSAPEASRQLGWRKLVRLKARPGSAARQNHIVSGIILFNIFTNPGAVPFSPTDESANTQVMLLTDPNAVAKQDGDDGMAALYWLDYDRPSTGGHLSLFLAAFFDANELPPSSGGKQPYYVPNGCVACHGESPRHAMVNYLDTDHWIDRLDTDFQALRAQGLPLLVDAGTNNPATPEYRAAFDVIKTFNLEAASQAKLALPTHDEVLAADKWLALHQSSYDHFAPIDRVIGPAPQWSISTPGNDKTLGALNQYCFRCHGTIKFSVFNKASVVSELAAMRARLSKDAETGVRMPPDRELPDDIRDLLLQPIN